MQTLPAVNERRYATLFNQFCWQKPLYSALGHFVFVLELEYEDLFEALRPINSSKSFSVDFGHCHPRPHS